LSPDEHVVLYTLVARAGTVVTHGQLATALGVADTTLRTNTIARHVSTLRRKLNDDAEHPRYIETVVGFGYGIRMSPRSPLSRTPTDLPARAGRPPTSDDS
jgi:DNA-binding response OmpR family regulator